MAKRRICERTSVDSISGEVLSSVSTWINKSSESFVMIRTTNGLKWYYSLSKNEKTLVLIMHEKSDSNTMVISFTQQIRKLICDTIGIKKRMLSILLSSLEGNDCFIRLSQNDFLMKPEHMFKCSTNELKKRIFYYKNVKDEKTKKAFLY